MIWQGICIHHSATRDSGTSSWKAIRRWHIENNGWDEIGYHYGIEDVNGALRLRIGRPLHLPGAHEPTYNRTHIGIVLIGNYDKDLPSRDRLDYLALVIADIIRNYRLELSPETLRYHRDAADKTCPGERFPPKEVLARMVERYL